MAKIDQLKAIIQKSTDLWNSDQHGPALKLLDENIALAKRDGMESWVRMLSRQATLIATSNGDLERSRKYCEDVLRSSPTDALALYSLAEVLFRQGETELAQRIAAKSYAIVQRSDSSNNTALKELLLHSWPEVIYWPSS